MTEDETKELNLLGEKGLEQKIWIVIDRSFDNYPDAEEVAESYRAMKIPIRVINSETKKESPL